ncbi:hypothetical protein [Hymenobacter gummosus]|nr:hypothetical protein [Hymenobacter gummosus]
MSANLVYQPEKAAVEVISNSIYQPRMGQSLHPLIELPPRGAGPKPAVGK